MAHHISTSEPTSARAGDTWRWTRSLSDYPAESWALTYTLVNASSRITIAAAAEGSAHAVHVPAATTGAYPPGRYDWIARVTDGVDIYQIASGSLQILPSLAAAADTRSHARKMLDAINALLEGRAAAGDLDLVRASHGDANISSERDLPTLLKLRVHYQAAVAQEEAALRLSRGERDPRLIQVRFR